MKYFGGCDVGSTYTKAVILDENGKIVADTTLKSKINAEESAKMAMAEVVSQVPDLKSEKDLAYILSFADCSVVITENSNQVLKIMNSKDKIPQLKTLIVFEEITKEASEVAKKGGVEIIPFAKVVEDGCEWRKSHEGAMEA